MIILETLIEPGFHHRFYKLRKHIQEQDRSKVVYIVFSLVKMTVGGGGKCRKRPCNDFPRGEDFCGMAQTSKFIALFGFWDEVLHRDPGVTENNVAEAQFRGGRYVLLRVLRVLPAQEMSLSISSIVNTRRIFYFINPNRQTKLVDWKGLRRTALTSDFWIKLFASLALSPYPR